MLVQMKDAIEWADRSCPCVCCTDRHASMEGCIACLKDWLAHVEVRLKVMHLHEDALLSFRFAHDVEAPATLFHHIKDHEVKRWVTALAILSPFGSATEDLPQHFGNPAISAQLFMQ